MLIETLTKNNKETDKFILDKSHPNEILLLFILFPPLFDEVFPSDTPIISVFYCPILHPGQFCPLNQCPNIAVDFRSCRRLRGAKCAHSHPLVRLCLTYGTALLRVLAPRRIVLPLDLIIRARRSFVVMVVILLHLFFHTVKFVLCARQRFPTIIPYTDK